MTLVVSTHFDDAVFSCWTVIDSADKVDVLTVFTAGPTDERTTEWDADTGATSAERMRKRAAENDAALAVAGRTAINLGLREGQYDGGIVAPSDLATHLAEADVVYVPAGVGLDGVHPEHVTVRDVCLALRRDARLYADNPYSHFTDIEPHGMPEGLERTVVELTPEQRLRKARAIHCYTGELRKLAGLFGSFANPDRLRFEVFWEPPQA